jgi:regulatory protein
MAGKITALRFQKRNKNRVNVYIDEEFAFGLAVIEAARLQVGQKLGDDEIAQLRWKDEIEQAYERALNFLSYRPRSKAEVRRNLRKKDVPERAIEIVVERLEKSGLLDDEEFARYWVDNRKSFNPRGAYALRHELWQKGVSDIVIDEALASFDEEAAAQKAADAGARKLSHHQPQDFRRKLQGYLKRRGFSYGLVRTLVKQKLDEVYEDDQP